MFYTLDIHIEYMDLNEDFHVIFAKALYVLICKGYIFFPMYDELFNFIKNNLDWFIIGVNAAEFYFNLLPDKVTVNEEAVKNNELIQYYVDGEGQLSFYSKDYKKKLIPNTSKGKMTRKVLRHSRVHHYDKYEKNLQDNHISQILLDSDPYHIRLEFKLLNDNCGFLSLDNFKGNYSQVLKRFTSYLAVIYNNYVVGKIVVKGKNNQELAKVIRNAKSAGTRYTDNKLKHAEKIPDWARSGKRDYRNQMKHMILEQKCQNDEMPEIVKEHVDIMLSSGNLADLVMEGGRK